MEGEGNGIVRAPSVMPRKSTAKPLPLGSAVQVLRLDSTGRNRASRELKLDKQILREMVDKAGDNPLGVIVIAGPGRRGKSLMLTYIVRYLQALERSENGDPGDWMEKENSTKPMKDKGFAFRNGMDRTTDGIWMWSRPFLVKRSESSSPIAVLVMDTEGCFDPYTNEQEQSSIIGLSLLLSSCFIYNDSGLINESTIATLAKFMQYGQVASQSFEGKAFQRLMFLIRDWTTSGFEHGAAGGQGFIRRCLASNPRMTEEANKNRQLIQDNFEDFNAYLMPFPGGRVTSEEFMGSISEMKDEFRSHLEKFASHLIADVSPKKFGSAVASGRTFLETFEKFARAFNEEDMPSPASILEITVYISLDAQIRKLTEEYEKEVHKKLQSKRVPFHSIEQLKKYHPKYKEYVVRKFQEGRRLGSANDHLVFADKLSQSVEIKFLEICHTNMMKQQEFVRTKLESSTKKFTTFIENNVVNSTKIWSQPEFEAIISPVLEATLQEFKNALTETPKAFSQEQSSSFGAKLQETAHRHWLELDKKRQEAEAKANGIVKNIHSNYIISMDLLVCDVLLTEARLAAFHERHRMRAIEDASRQLGKEFLDDDFVRKFQAESEAVINAEFENIRKQSNDKIKGIISIMEKDLEEIVEVFKEEGLKEIQKTPSLNNANLERILTTIQDMGMESLESSGHPDRQVIASYRRRLRENMQAAIQELRDSILQSREYKLRELELIFQATAEKFVQQLGARGCQDLLLPEEVEALVLQISEEILPKYEAKIRELSLEDTATFLQRYHKLVVDKKQDLLLSNLSKAQQLEREVHDKIDTLSEIYNEKMKSQEGQWTQLDHLVSSHERQSSQLYERLLSETLLNLYPKLVPKYQRVLEEEIQKYCNIFHSSFELKQQQRKTILGQTIPEWVSAFEYEMQNYIRNNPLDEDPVIIEKMEEKVRELKARVEAHLSEVIHGSSDVEEEALKQFRDEVRKVKKKLTQQAVKMRDTTDSTIKGIVKSCHEFAGNHPIFNESSSVDSSSFDRAQEKLKNDAREYFNSKWSFPSSSTSQAKENAWAEVQIDLEAKLKALFTHVLAKTKQKSEILSLITESVLTNLSPQMENSLDRGKFLEEGALANLLLDGRRKAKAEYLRQLSEKNITVSGEAKEFESRIDARIQEISKKNTTALEVAFAEAKEICHNLIYERVESVKAHTDLDALRKEAEQRMFRSLQAKSMEPLKEESCIIAKMYEYAENLFDAHLEHLTSSVSSDQARRVVEEAIKMYDTTMRKCLEGRTSVNPENLLEFHIFSARSTLKRSSRSCFLTEQLESSIRERLQHSYGILEDQNNLQHAQASNVAIGIDLGTTTSCVAVYKNGEVTVIKDDSGRTLTPSYVSFDESGSPIAGNEAKNRAPLHPEDTIFDAKRLIGRQFDDPHVQEDMKTWPFKIEPDEMGRPVIAVRDMRFSPEGISAKILGHMRRLAAKHLNQKITKAVITVPANFTDRQRDATRQAAMIAGLDVLQIINEPTAAAMAYALNWKDEEKTVLVYDFGGGTFDVTLLKTEVGSVSATPPSDEPTSTGRASMLAEAPKPQGTSGGGASGVSRLRVVQTAGDTHLGGEDCDSRMVNYCIQQFRRQHGVQLLEQDGERNLRTQQGRNRILRRLRNECETAKAELTSATSTIVEIDGIHGELDLKVTISRTEFERMNMDLFQKTIDIVRRAIQEANLQPRDITDVLMVGGSSRIPRVRQLLQEFLGLPVLNINQRVDIQEAVAMGAAIQACILDGGASIQNLPLIKDIQPFSLGIMLNTGKMSVIIRRNTSIPCEGSNPYQTSIHNQKEVTIDIFAGEEKMAADNVLLGQFTLEGIPPGRAGSQSIRVSMKIDASGILNVTASTTTGRSKNLVIKECRGRYSDEEMADMRRGFEHSGN